VVGAWVFGFLLGWFVWGFCLVLLGFGLVGFLYLVLVLFGAGKRWDWFDFVWFYIKTININ
jgi:hypothetical protein